MNGPASITKPSYATQTTTHQDFKYFDSLLYTTINGKRIKIFNDETAKLITPLGLLFWYMDDGTLAHKEWINLSTNNFSFEENTIIATMFKKNFGIDAKIYLIKSQQRYYIRLNKESTRRFMSLLKPFKKFIPPSMSYKFTFLRQAS
jgi:hypothetical protein